MRAQCVVLLAFLALQACNAQELVNLVEKHETSFAPQGYHGSSDWLLFDHDPSTYQKVRDVRLWFQFAYPIRPTKYRITMAAHVQPEDYPPAWTVTVSAGYEDFEEFVPRADAVFKDGVFEGSLPKEVEATRLRIYFGGPHDPEIAEIEVLGPRESLDALWPYGKYPCSERLAIITRLAGPEQIFSETKYPTSQEELRPAFDGKDLRGVDLFFDDENPLVVGAILPEATVVHQVSMTAWQLELKGVRQVILEGSECDPRSNTGGSCNGWTWLAAEEPLPYGNGYQQAPRLFVENPGEYRAYRVKFIPSPDKKIRNNIGKSISLRGLFFLGCTAGTPEATPTPTALATPTALPTRAECVDTDSRCDRWSGNGFCDSVDRPWVPKKCPKACNRCVTASPTPSASATATASATPTALPSPAECVDTDSRCDRWSGNGFCDGVDRPWVPKKCPKACNRCAKTLATPSASATPTALPTRAECVDTDSRCDRWSGNGFCDDVDRPWVPKKCPKACNRC